MKNKSDFFKANFIYFIILSIFILVRIAANTSLFGFLGDAETYVLNIIIQIIAMLILPLVLFTILKKQTYKKTLKDFSVKKINLKAVVYSLMLGIVVFFLNLVVSVIFNAIISALGYSSSGSSTMTEYPFWLFLVTLLFTAILPGICEEFTHRGLLLAGNKKLGMKKAIILSALFFGLMHLNIEQFFYATIIGLLLGYLTVVSGSIIPSMIVHFMNNAISVYLSFASINNLWLGNFYAKISLMFSQGFFLAMGLVLTLVIVGISLLAILVYLIIKETRLKNLTEITTMAAKQELRRRLFLGIDDQQQENSEIDLSFSPIGVSIKMPIDDYVYPIKETGKLTRPEKIMFYGNLLMSLIITVCTFSWGCL